MLHTCPFYNTDQNVMIVKVKIRQRGEIMPKTSLSLISNDP